MQDHPRKFVCHKLVKCCFQGMPGKRASYPCEINTHSLTCTEPDAIFLRPQSQTFYHKLHLSHSCQKIGWHARDITLWMQKEYWTLGGTALVMEFIFQTNNVTLSRPLSSRHQSCICHMLKCLPRATLMQWEDNHFSQLPRQWKGHLPPVGQNILHATC